MKFDGYRGSWDQIDDLDLVVGGVLRKFRLMEHTTYGDEAQCLVVDDYNHVVGETFDGLRTFMREEFNR